jgi:3-oxoadipate enol-lactonase
MSIALIHNEKFQLSVEVDDFTAPWRNDKTPLVLQHGFGRHAGIWTTWVPLLSADFPILRPNLRGIGHKPTDFDAATDLSMDAYLSDLCRILDELDIEAIHYCGESFGGCIGLAMAAKHPDRIKTLSLISTPVFYGPKWQESYAMGHGTWSNALRTMGVDAWLAATNESTRFAPGVSTEFLAWYNAMVASTDPEVLMGMAALIEQSDLKPILPHVKAPVMLLSPMQGNIMNNAQVDAYRASLKDFSLIRFDTPFHKIQLLEAATCASHIAHFCSQFDQRSLGVRF